MALRELPFISMVVSILSPNMEDCAERGFTKFERQTVWGLCHGIVWSTSMVYAQLGLGYDNMFSNTISIEAMNFSPFDIGSISKTFF
jgi:hypothetical protein